MAKDGRRLAESVFPPTRIARRRRRFVRRRRLFRDVLPGDVFMPHDPFHRSCCRSLRGIDDAFLLKDLDDAAVRQKILVAQGVPIERVMTKEKNKAWLVFFLIC